MDIQTLEDERRRAIQQQGDLRMGVSGGWNVAGGNMRSSPFADFEPFDDGNDYPEDYRGQPVFGVEEDGQMFFDFPFVQAPNDMQIASASDIGQQVLQQRAAESKAGKIDRGSRSYIGEDHQRAREIDGEIYWYDEYKHMPFYQKILQKYGHTDELQQIQNEMSQ